MNKEKSEFKRPGEIRLSGIVIIVGNYGSGKTEVTINLAVNRKRAGMDVRVADLDLVNPYFRAREVHKPLAKLGIEVVLPPEQYLHADLPILTPAVSGMIRQPSELTLLDVGGDDAGATVLSALAEPLSERQVSVMQVINPFRPFTDTLAGCLEIRERIENASRVSIQGIIGNPNLIDDTRVADIYTGYDFVSTLASKSGLPLAFITTAAELLPQVDLRRFSCPVLPIYRQLVPPWRNALKMTHED